VVDLMTASKGWKFIHRSPSLHAGALFLTIPCSSARPGRRRWSGRALALRVEPHRVSPPSGVDHW